MKQIAKGKSFAKFACYADTAALQGPHHSRRAHPGMMTQGTIGVKGDFAPLHFCENLSSCLCFEILPISKLS